VDDTNSAFRDPELYLDIMAVGSFQGRLRNLNDQAPFFDVDTLRTQVDSNVRLLKEASVVWFWPESHIGSGSIQDQILRSLRFVDVGEIEENPEIYDRYVESLGINGADALRFSTDLGVPTETAWHTSCIRVWGLRLREEHGPAWPE
jgi:hypothetical protein